MTRFLTVAQASEEYFVPERTVRTWVARGLVRWVGAGLLADDEVMAAERATRRNPRLLDLLAKAGAVESSSAPENPSHPASKMSGMMTD